MRVDTGQHEPTISELYGRIEQLEQRVGQLEHGIVARKTVSRGPAKPVAAEPDLDEGRDLALFGGTLIGIGGGFLLRALTESHIVPGLAGVALGVVYAFVWLWFADRHARRGQIHAATFDAVVMAAVIFPLSWEVSVRFEVIPASAALALMLVSACALVFSGWKRNIASFVWLAALAAIPCSAALALGHSRVSAAVVSLMIVGAAVWWTARDRGWNAVELPIPMALTMMTGVAAMVASSAHGKDVPELVALALCGSFLIYAGTVTARTLLTGGDLTKYDLLAITPPALFMVTGSTYLASRFAGARPAVPLLFGIAAAAAYALAVRNCRTQPIARLAFAAMGFVCTIASTAVMLTPSQAGVLWSLLATGFALTAVPDLMVHAALYALVAVASSGLLMKALTLISGIGGSARLRLVDVATMAIVATAALVTLVRREPHKNAATSASRMTLLALTIFLGTAAAARLLVGLLANDTASAATARSAAIAAVAVGLIFVARIAPFRELSRLVYPLLCVGAAKFITDDFIGGRAATLFASLAIYGMALLAVAKFRRAAPPAVHSSAVG